MKRCNLARFDAYEVGVKLEGGLEEYALNFLHIFNNVKNNPDDLIRVTNDYNDGVYVVCRPEVLEETKKYLSSFGEVHRVEKVLCLEVDEYIDYDYDTYDDLILVPYRD